MFQTAAALLLASTAIGAEYGPVVGQPHPDFVLLDIDTRAAVALSDFRGKKTILIHFASW